MDPMQLCPGKGLVLPKINIDETATHARFLLLSLPNNVMSQKSPFAIQKALIAIGGEPKSVKRLRSGDLLIETISAVQTKSFLLAKTFLDSSVSIYPHKSLNTCRGVISEPDLLTIPDAEILEGFSDQGVIQVRRITIKKEATVIPTKHLILTFNSPNLPFNIKAGYLNCKIRPYVPNPLRCFKCQRFGHSQTVCRGNVTCSRCASVGHSSTDCSLEPKCINCSQSHPSDSKLCPKWKLEKEIQAIKTNKNISYVEARKLIAPHLPQTYAQATQSLTVNDSTQTDENITKIIFPPLTLLQPASHLSKQNISTSAHIVSTSSSSTQTYLLPSTSTISESQPPIPKFNTNGTVYLADQAIVKKSRKQLLPRYNETSTPRLQFSKSNIPTQVAAIAVDNFAAKKQPLKPCKKKRLREKKSSLIEIKMAPYRPKKSTPIQDTSDEEEMFEAEEVNHRGLTPTRNRK